jgi:molybdenum cofactor biosynthesis protein B
MTHRFRKKKLHAAVLTVSSTKSERNDLSGKIAKDILSREGHHVSYYRIIPDDASMIKNEMRKILKKKIDFIILSGGTGLSKDDVTVEATLPLFEKEIDGFGEIFRLLSYRKIGTSTILSRAVAGIVSGKPVFCLPGAPDAVKLGMEKIILPEIHHIIGHAKER